MLFAFDPSFNATGATGQKHIPADIEELVAASKVKRPSLFFAFRQIRLTVTSLIKEMLTLFNT